MDTPASDTSRAIQHELSREWPEVVEIRLGWKTKSGRLIFRSTNIGIDEFFGRGRYGAPISGDRIVAAIERMRKQGTPEGEKQDRRK